MWYTCNRCILYAFFWQICHNALCGHIFTNSECKEIDILLAPRSVSRCFVSYTVRRFLSLRDLAAWIAWELPLLAAAWLGCATTLGPLFVRRMGVPLIDTSMRSPLMSFWVVTLLGDRTEFWPTLSDSVPPDGWPSNVWGGDGAGLWLGWGWGRGCCWWNGMAWSTGLTLGSCCMTISLKIDIIQHGNIFRSFLYNFLHSMCLFLYFNQSL